MVFRFEKYEGAGNDFILLDDRDEAFNPDARLIASLCDRHFGIGADGLMTLRRSATSDGVMRYFNADGSEGEMCGNGARCFALFLQWLGIGGKVKRFEATDGLHTARLLALSGACAEIEVRMRDVQAVGESGEGWFLDTGVPHYVEFVPRCADIDVISRGRALRHDTARFPSGVNVDFVETLGNGGDLRMRTYERGVENETLACGTGAVAAAIAADYARQNSTASCHIEVPGGELRVSFRHTPGTQIYTDIRLTGAARHVFGGTFDSDNF